MSFQTTIFIGNLGKDPELRYIPSGQAVCSFPVASNEVRKVNGEVIKETTWYRVSVWGKQAESCNTYLHKGSRVLVEGKLKPDPETGNPRMWSRDDGSTGTSFDITASTVRFLSGKTEDEEPSDF